MEIVNLTPHPVTLRTHEGAETTIPSTSVARVAAAEVETGDVVGGVPVIRQTLGEVEGLPEPRDGVRLIVSRIVAAAAAGRDDLVVPARLVRDDAGRIVACEALEVLS